MKKPNILVPVAFVAVLALAALQGAYVDYLRNSSGFYYWLIAAGNEMRTEGRVGDIQASTDEEGPKKVDTEFYRKVEGKVEKFSALPEVPATAEDKNKTGEPSSKLVRIVRRGGDNLAKDQWDYALWKVARSGELAPERAEFRKLLRDGRLSTAGTQAGLLDMYKSGATVNLANMFFGFRKMAANLLWLQVDSYWHKGMLYRMVPLMKTTVALDPGFVDAFLLGAWHLSYNATATMKDTPEPLKQYVPKYQARMGTKEEFYYQGIDFLKDGIRKNPRNYKLYFDLGFAIYELKLEDHANAVHYLSEAIRYKHDKWVPRTLYLSLQKNGQYEEALAGWQWYMAKPENKDNANGPRFIKINQALILTRDSDEAYGRGDAAKGAELQAKARAMWDDIAKNDQDPFALMHLRRMDALELARQGRYVEAIPLLDQSRFETPDHFDDISALIIKLKKQGKIPLSLSERMYLARQEEADQFIAEELRKITGKEYVIRDEVWYEQGYNNQEATLLTPGSEKLNALRAKHPDLNVILAFRQPLVFQVEQNWYKFRPRVEL